MCWKWLSPDILDMTCLSRKALLNALTKDVSDPENKIYKSPERHIKTITVLPRTGYQEYYVLGLDIVLKYNTIAINPWGILLEDVLVSIPVVRHEKVLVPAADLKDKVIHSLLDDKIYKVLISVTEYEYDEEYTEFLKKTLLYDPSRAFVDDAGVLAEEVDPLTYTNDHLELVLNKDMAKNGKILIPASIKAKKIHGAWARYPAMFQYRDTPRKVTAIF